MISELKVSDTVLPPKDNMGVEFKSSWHIDYLVLTKWGSGLKDYFEGFFSDELGELLDQGHGGRFYRNTYAGMLGVILRSDPIGEGEEARETLEIPGKACQVIGYDRLSRFYKYLISTPGMVRINRIDTAFNHCPFSVEDLYQAIQNNEVRSLFKRYTLKYFENKYEKDEKGKVGTSGITIGGRSSERYLRVYNKHGYTRLEVEYKHTKADIVGVDLLLANDTKEALRYAVGHLKDYIEFHNDLWDEFYSDLDRLYSKLPMNVQEMSITEIKKWFEKQVAGSFYILSNFVKDEDLDYWDMLYKLGKFKVMKSKGRNKNLGRFITQKLLLDN
jgi:hypothetical protein